MGEYDVKQRNLLCKAIAKGNTEERQLKGLVDNRPQTIDQTRIINSIQKKLNNTGLPDNLKSGIENLSGYSLDDVKVHYNSDKPAQLQALAYAQGTDIHLAPGQENHLPHEAWHVVQQKQGRVQSTTQLEGIYVNDNQGLEKEADVMGIICCQNNSMTLANKNKNISTAGNIVQRCGSKVKEFFTNFKKSGAKKILLFTIVKEDGLGDAGQLGYLYDKLKSINYFKSNGISVETYAAYHIAQNKDIIKKLAKIEEDSRLVLIENTKTSEAIIAIKEKLDLVNDWIIQYPFPASNFNNDKMLKIKEMGFPALENQLKAGTAYGGIGYGIPNIYTEAALSKEELSLSMIIDKDADNFKNAIFASVKPKGYSSEDKRLGILNNLIKMTKEQNRYLVITKNDDFEKTEECRSFDKEIFGSITLYKKDKYKIIHGVFSNAFMRFLMCKITDGMIISGGEGMFAESLNTAKDYKNKSIAVIAGRYDFQYSEIAFELSKMENLEKIDSIFKNKNKYRIFLDDDNVIYYDGNVKIIVCKNFKKVKGVFSSKSLAALYLPLHHNI